MPPNFFRKSGGIPVVQAILPAEHTLRGNFAMGKYIAKRILISLVTLLVLMTVVFILVRLMPGGPFVDPKMTPAIKARLEAYYGLDKPIYIQFFQYISNILHGDLGYSMAWAFVPLPEARMAIFRGIDYLAKYVFRASTSAGMV